MTIGVVQERGETTNGARFVVIDSQRYYVSKSKTDPSGLTTGSKVDFTYNEFGEPYKGKRSRGIVDWKPVLDAAGQPETGSTVAEVDILRSVSNVVASACAAGTVTSPEELLKWFVAAEAGFRSVLAPQPPKEPKHEFDDSDAMNQDMPDKFYEGLPPQKTGNSRW